MLVAERTNMAEMRENIKALRVCVRECVCARMHECGCVYSHKCM